MDNRGPLLSPRLSAPSVESCPAACWDGFEKVSQCAGWRGAAISEIREIGWVLPAPAGVGGGGSGIWKGPPGSRAL